MWKLIGKVYIMKRTNTYIMSGCTAEDKKLSDYCDWIERRITQLENRVTFLEDRVAIHEKNSYCDGLSDK